MSGLNAGPMRTGPPAPFSIKATRRRMSARMPLAEFGFGDDEAAQPLGGNEKRLDVGLCARVDERGAARQLSDFGKELARSFFDDRHHMAQAIPRVDGDNARNEHEHTGARFAGHEQ
jgi:hypothetical protein